MQQHDSPPTEGLENGVTASTQPEHARRKDVIYRRHYSNVLTNEVIHVEDVDDPWAGPDDAELPRFEVIQHFWGAEPVKKPGNEGGAGSNRPKKHSRGSDEILIHSRAAIHALQTVVGYYPDARFSGSYVSMLEPFLIVQHHRKQLESYRDQFKPGTVVPDDCIAIADNFEDVSTLLKIVFDRYDKELHAEEQRRQASVPLCTHSMLWALFKPGMTVYWDQNGDGEYNAAVVGKVSCSYEAEITLSLWFLDCDNDEVGPTEYETETIEPFSGEREIASLNCFPCEYMTASRHKSSHKEHAQYLQARGKKFFDFLKGAKCAKFDGYTTGRPKFHHSGHVMLDMGEYSRMVDFKFLTTDTEHLTTVTPRCSCSRCEMIRQEWARSKQTFSGYSKINPLKQQSLSDHQRMICTNTLPAFLFKDREWKKLHVDGFSDIVWRTDMINSLVIESSTRTLLEDLAEKYTRAGSDMPWAADFVPGKGEGLVILLHGRPGVGKTYTAECVAEEAKRPLIALTCADIGIDPVEAEKNLQYWFKLATHWGAILLIDEADVYMEERRMTDLKRNNLVAGFLRKLEYYRGILFLTTNRIGTFDEAFFSRIDVPIYYADFTPAQRREIWERFFRKLEKDKYNVMTVPQRTRDYVRTDAVLLGLKWNARQIRSAFQTAVALAEVEGKKKHVEGIIFVEPEHIGTTVKMSQDFREYLKDLFKKDASERAAGRRLRADAFGVDNTGDDSAPFV